MTLYNWDNKYPGSRDEKLDGQFTRDGVERESVGETLTKDLEHFMLELIANSKIGDDRIRDALWREYFDFRSHCVGWPVHSLEGAFQEAKVNMRRLIASEDPKYARS